MGRAAIVRPTSIDHKLLFSQLITEKGPISEWKSKIEVSPACPQNSYQINAIPGQGSRLAAFK
jgi:hypothetical protein